MEGDFQFLTIAQTQKGEIVVKKKKEILIPVCVRKQLKIDMHQGHLLDCYMLNLAKDHFFWPGMREELKAVYKECESCLTYASSKPEDAYDVTPEPLLLLSPNKKVSMDYMQVLDRDILLIKCKQSGHIWGRITPK